VIATISVPAHPVTVKADPFTIIILVTNLAANKLTFISGETNRIVKSLDTGTAPWGMDVDSYEHVAYVTNRGGNYVPVIDLLAQSVITRIPIGAPCTGDLGRHIRTYYLHFIYGARQGLENRWKDKLHFKYNSDGSGTTGFGCRFKNPQGLCVC
jgi:DNA-binding beta-propeller fold protein YncE